MASNMIRRIYFQGNEHYQDVSRPGYWSGWLIIALLSLLTASWLGYRWLTQPSWVTNLPNSFTDTLNLIELAAVVSLVLVWIVLIWRRYLRYKNEAGALAISREKLLKMDPQVFELFVAALFRKRGHRVIVRGGSGDHGVDLELVNSGGRRAIVQCKRYRDTVGEKTVRDLFGTLLHERASRAFMVTTADISDAAVRWARGKPITLINGKQLVDIATAMKEK